MMNPRMSPKLLKNQCWLWLVQNVYHKLMISMSIRLVSDFEYLKNI